MAQGTVLLTMRGNPSGAARTVKRRLHTVKVLLVLLVLGLLLALAGGITFTGWYSTTDSNGVVHVHCLSGCKSGTYVDGTSLPESSAVKDALAVHAAAFSSARAGQATKRMVAVLDRATNEPGSRGAALIRRDLPPLLTTILDEIPGVRDNLLAVDVQTTAGQNCRVAALREVSTFETVYRHALNATDAGRSPAQIFFIVMNGGDAALRGYKRDVRPCLAALQPDDRAAVKYILGG
jgi:hypothetical protein